MGFTTYTVLTTVLFGGLFMGLIVIIAPFIKAKYSMKLVVLAALLLILRFIFPIELPFTKEIELTFLLPDVQRLLDMELTVRTSLIYAWLVGVFYWACVKLFGTEARASRKYVKECSREVPANIERAMIKLREEKNWTFPYALYTDSPDGTVLAEPMVTGIFRAKLLIPNYDYSDEDLHNILLHECTHYVLNDVFIKGLLQVIFIVFWFIPKKRLLIHTVNDLLENRCDEVALEGKGKDEKRAYIGSISFILNEAEARGRWLTESQIDSLTARIERIRKPPKHSKAKSLGFGLLILAALSLSFLVVIQPRIEPEGYEHGQEVIGKFYLDELENYAVFKGGGIITVYFQDMPHDVTYEVYVESFGDLPLFYDKELLFESEDAE